MRLCIKTMGTTAISLRTSCIFIDATLLAVSRALRAPGFEEEVSLVAAPQTCHSYLWVHNFRYASLMHDIILMIEHRQM
jgi:hypothetical protein